MTEPTPSNRINVFVSFVASNQQSGWCGILEFNGQTKEIVHVIRQNMIKRQLELEISAIVKIMQLFPEPTYLTYITNNRQLVEGAALAQAARLNNWKYGNNKRVPSPHLWESLLAAVAIHSVEFELVPKRQLDYPLLHRASRLAEEAVKGIKNVI